MDAVVAVFSDWGIGAEGTQQVVLKADRAHFRALTEGAAVIVGRAPPADFPGGRPLKNRHNIVVTRQAVEIEGAEVVHSAAEAVDCARKYPRTLVIGGESIYRQLLPETERVYVTRIELAPQSTAFFPNLDEDGAWLCTERGEAQEEDGIVYRFLTYERVK